MSLLRLLPRFRAAKETIEQINEMRTWFRSDLREFQLEQINRLWRYAVATVPHYRDLKSKQDLPEQFDSLEQYSALMPVLSKANVRDHGDSFLSSQHEKGNWQRTGGSTGIPTSIFWSQTAHRKNLCLRYAWLKRYNVETLDRHAMLWGHGASFAPGIKGLIARTRRPIEDRIRKRQRLNAYHIGPANLDRYLDTLQRSRTQWLYGYSSAILLLANRAIDTNRKFEHIKMVIMTGEPALPPYADRVKQAFNAPGRIEYGSVECGNIAYENNVRKMEIQESCRFVETIDRKDGSHDVIVTVLDNPSFPLFRYAIGDTTSSPLVTPEAGPAFLEDVQGRNNDFFVARDGKFVHSNLIKHAMENVPYVNRFQAVQELDGSVHIEVESPNGKPMNNAGQAVERLKTVLGGLPVSISNVESIQGNQAGKHTWAKSKLFEEMVSD